MRPRFALFAIACVLTAIAAHGRAEATAPAAGGAQVSLAAFMVPVRQSNGRMAEMAVTPVLRLAGGAAAASVCSLAPRLTEAFVAALYRDPLPAHGEAGLNIDSARNRLTEAVNVALGRFMVIGVDLVPADSPTAPDRHRLNGALPCHQPANGAY